MPRLFIAIKITPSKALEDTYSELKQKLSQSKINWVNRHNFHLTLKFLGDVEDYYVNSLHMILEQVAAGNSSFILETTEISFFGRKRQPQVIWYGYKPNLLFNKLATSIEDSLTELGFEKEDKNNLPHLTLGRVKYLAPENNLQEILSSVMPASSCHQVNIFSLIKSTLTPNGAVYNVINNYKLTGS